MEVAVEPCPNFLVCPTLYGLGHHPGLGVHNQLEFGALFRGDRGFIERYGVGNGHPVAVLLYDVQYPTAERLSYRSPGEHRNQMASPKGKDANPDRQIDGVEVFNNLRHVFGEFVCVSVIQAAQSIFSGIP